MTTVEDSHVGTAAILSLSVLRSKSLCAGLRALHERASEEEASAPVEAEEASGELAAPEAPSLEANVVSASPSRAMDLASACSKDVQSLRALLEQRGIKLAGWTRFQDSGAELIRRGVLRLASWTVLSSHSVRSPHGSPARVSLSFARIPQLQTCEHLGCHKLTCCSSRCTGHSLASC